MNSQNFPNGGVDVHRSQGIATITFYHPQSNSLPGAVLRSLAENIENEMYESRVQGHTITPDDHKRTQGQDATPETQPEPVK
jgi:hypothetical protein